MKFLTFCALVGAISAYDFEEEDYEIEEFEDFEDEEDFETTDEDEEDLLKVEVSPAGEKAIKKEAMDVKMTMKKIHNWKTPTALRKSFKKWAATKEVANLKKIDEAFLKSPAGKKLIKEWTDVGEALKKHVKKTKTGLHIENANMNDVQKELKDVEGEYKKLEKSKWAKAYEAGWKAALHNKEAADVGKKFEAFKKSPAHKVLKKEVVELKEAIKKNVKVSDVPKEWKEEEDFLKVEITPAGEKAINKEGEDIKKWGEANKNKPVVKNTGAAIHKWATAKEMKALEALDKKFLASPEGKKMMKEWKEFGAALKKHIKKTPQGIHIDNANMNDIQKEGHDVELEYKKMEKSKWGKAYEAGWKAATHNAESKALAKQWGVFEKSAEAKALAKELHDLELAIKKNVHVSDVPKEWKEEEDFEEEEEDDLYLF